MKNNLNFSENMKNLLRFWKNKQFVSFTENDSENVTVVRFFIDDKIFDVSNDYTLYEYSDKDSSELTCFSCIETDKDKELQTTVVEGKCKENIVLETILNVYLITDTEKGRLFDSGVPYELTFNTALIVQTERHCYAFWRHIVFNAIEVTVCENLETALKAIKSVEEILEDAQNENPYSVTVERTLEQL